MLGDRIHPATWRRMIYVVCEVLAGTARSRRPGRCTNIEWCSRARVAELVSNARSRSTWTHISRSDPSGSALFVLSGRKPKDRCPN
jgi:hypothetical protein